jgi:D-proline reductase (dithiol) PrdB
VCTTKAILPSTCHPFGDFRFRRVLSASRYGDLIIPQLKYPHDDADVDINVIFPIERLQELGSEGVLGGLTENFFSFIGYNMDPEKFERSVAHDIAAAVVAEERADVALLAPA